MEIEMMMIRLDEDNKKAPLLCKAKDIIDPLQKAENENPGNTDTAWRPEMTEYMIECKYKVQNMIIFKKLPVYDPSFLFKKKILFQASLISVLILF